MNLRPLLLAAVVLLVARPLVAAEPPHFTYTVVQAWPHDTRAFTEGLTYLDGALYESTGLNGHSTLRKVELSTGKVLQQVTLGDDFFGEGMTILHGKIYQLSWKNQVGFVYDLTTLREERRFAYTGEGWGLTTDGHSLIMSDGTNQIRFIDPATFAVTRTIQVMIHGAPLDQLNELEWVNGHILANVWQTPSIVSIDPADGTILGVIDLIGLLPTAERVPSTDVLNGIAYDPAGDRLFVTGKFWPKLYQIALKPAP